MSNYRLRTPDRTLDLGEFDNAQEALESAVSLQPDFKPTDGTLELQVGEEWHEVGLEGDMS